MKPQQRATQDIDAEDLLDIDNLASVYPNPGWTNLILNGCYGIFPRRLQPA